jgi:hypothetical protein
MNSKTTGILLLACFFCTVAAHAHDTQDKRVCGTMEVYERMLKDPDFLKNRQWINDFTQKLLSQNPHYRASSVPIVIPVVVHVVYQTAAQNIPDSRIQSQIDQLNADFSATNSDIGNVPSVFQSLVANTNIQFCLAKRDPNGNPHSGIIKKQTTVSTFSLDDAVKFDAQGGSNAWPRDSYLNIWVCNLANPYLGYATFPGGPANVDGVVVLYTSVGSISNPHPNGGQYNIGRTATHEIGHWLNLYHIWGSGTCGDDQVSDTPKADNPHYGCPTHPHHVNQCGAGTSPNGEMTMNYMDYTNDACMYMFTQGQSARMNAALSGPRLPLQSSQGCLPVNLQQIDAGISAIIQPVGTICASSISPQVTLKNFGLNTLNSVTINYKLNNGPVSTYNWTGNLTTGATANITLNAISFGGGSHTFNVYTSNPNGSPDQNTSNDGQNSSFTNASIGQALPLQEGFQSTTFPPTGFTINNPDGGITWQRTTAAGQASTASVFMDFINYTFSGATDDLNTPPLNLTTQNNPQLKFWVAYAQYSPSYVDTLQVLISTNCGSTWSSIYKKFGTALATAPNTTIPFVPSANQWRQETVSLASYASAQGAIIRFRGISDYGNNLYVDNINIQGMVGVNEPASAAGILLLPNPAQDVVHMIIPETMTGVVYIRVVDTKGSAVMHYRLNTAESRKAAFDFSGMARGLYVFEISHRGNHYFEKVRIE